MAEGLLNPEGGPGFHPWQSHQSEGGKCDESEATVPECSIGGKHFICMTQTLIKTKNPIRGDVHGNKTLAMSPKTH